MQRMEAMLQPLTSPQVDNPPSVHLSLGMEPLDQFASRTRLEQNRDAELSSLIDLLPDSAVPHFFGSEVVELSETLSRRPLHKPKLISILPKSEITTLAEFYLDEINPIYPLFHRSFLLAIIQHRYSNGGEIHDPAWWACLNSIIALSVQSKRVSSAHRHDSQQSWTFFKNAFSVFEELTTGEPSLLVVRALLTMAIFLSGSADRKTMLLLVSTAVRMIHILGLHREDPNARSRIDAEQRRRLFWVAYMLDRHTSIDLGLPFTLDDGSFQVNLPSDDVIDGLLDLTASNAKKNVNTFRLRVQLAIIESQAFDRLFGMNVTKSQEGQVDSPIAELLSELVNWIGDVPVDIRPVFEAKTPASACRMEVLLLHLRFYNCEGMMLRAKGPHVSQQPAMIKTARATLLLVKNVEGLAFAHLWYVRDSNSPTRAC